eukprot:23870-Amphidinium_carterae.1
MVLPQQRNNKARGTLKSNARMVFPQVNVQKKYQMRWRERSKRNSNRQSQQQDQIKHNRVQGWNKGPN